MQESTKRSAARPTAEEIGKYLKYDPETGVITWRVTMGSRSIAGQQAGANVVFKDGKRYRQIGLGGKKYYGHAIAWLLATGRWPSHELFHKDGDGLNNALDNLRDEPRALNNQASLRAMKNNALGIRGVFKSRSGRFIARIKVHGEKLHLGTFDSVAEASAAYLEAKRQFHPGCFHLNPS